VLTGLFPELGGGAGLNLGKDRMTGLIESFGGRVTSAVSGATSCLVVGQAPGGSKVGKAAERGLQTVSSAGLKLVAETAGMALRDAPAPPPVEAFSQGYRGNGIMRISGGGGGGKAAALPSFPGEGEGEEEEEVQVVKTKGKGKGKAKVPKEPKPPKPPKAPKVPKEPKAKAPKRARGGAAAAAAAAAEEAAPSSAAAEDAALVVAAEPAAAAAAAATALEAVPARSKRARKV
jgi:hypothetical protein